MANSKFTTLVALTIIFFFGGITIIVAGGACAGRQNLCVIPLDGSIAIIVLGIALFILSILGYGMALFTLRVEEMALNLADPYMEHKTTYDMLYYAVVS